ncbi:hypothetical protein [Longilinea arvoryzae]|nr:hypothetical protein [Longilinea arvoryzae]
MRFRSVLLALTLLATLAACSATPPIPTEQPTAAPTELPSPTDTASPAPTGTATLTATATETPTPTATLTPIPTYVVLRGIVNQEHVSCFYGPSKAYLYKYGLLKGNRLDIIGYIADTGYIEVQAIGGDNPCWMNLEWMDVQGDINQVQPVDPLTVKRPWSTRYDALDYVTATRKGDEVTITWAPMVLIAGDDSEQEPYLLETWVCRDGKLTFVPIGAYETTATVVDQAGCSEPSFGRVYGVEKHGYTKYLKIDWPQAGK